MLDRFEQLNMNQTSTEWFCRGLIDLANSDGLHETELEIIQEFCVANQLAQSDFEALSTQGFDLDDAKAHLTGETLDAFMTTCFVLAYADGQLSDLESKRLSAYADALGYSAADFEQAHVDARVFLISSIAQEIKNHGLLREIAAGFGLNEEQISTALSGGN